MADEQKREMSRRKFLTAGAIAAGTMAVGGGIFGAFNSNVAQAKETCNIEVPSWPWPYVKLDAEKAKVLAYEGYGIDRCCYGVFRGIMVQLQEKVGYPYTMIPIEIMQWGATGGAGWGTLCGALMGASTAINFVVGPSRKDVEKVVNELYGWYTTFEFPKYKPPLGKAIKAEGAIPTSVSGSPLCHVSVGNWCSTSKYRAEGKERSERCARLTADVAAKTVELLNDWHSNKFAAAYKDTQSVEECMTCHGKGRSLENARGKQDCIQCHDDVNPNDLLEHIKKNWEIK
ncbi:MAG: hypothetical protein PWQ96_1713 [Clostridia bacterium]|jgi:hypothetical protein|nr:putative redox-active protein GCAxxG [Clostridiales bacterium]MDK2986069.1 hypothetical protein [Clostridia bacterium]